MERRRSLNVVRVHWVDSSTASGWQNEGDLRDSPMECVTIGFLVRKLPKVIEVALSYGSLDEVNLNFCDIISIPQVAIIKITMLYKEKIGYVKRKSIKKASLSPREVKHKQNTDQVKEGGEVSQDRPVRSYGGRGTS